MKEDLFFEIRKEVFKKIQENRRKEQRIIDGITSLKETLDKKVNGYQGFTQTKRLEAERALLLEKIAYDLLDGKHKLTECEQYKKRAEIFLKCIIALSNNNYEDYQEFVDEFVDELQEQALEQNKIEIQKSRQKRIVYVKTKQWLKILEDTKKEEFELKKGSLISKEEADKESMKIFELEEEQELMKKAFQIEKEQLQRTDFYDTKLLDSQPKDTIRRIYPELKDQLLEMNEAKGKSTR